MLRVGDVVKVIKESRYSGYEDTFGREGIIVHVANTGKYAVQIEGLKNPHPWNIAAGSFWMLPNELRFVRHEEFVLKPGDTVNVISITTSSTSTYKGIATFIKYVGAFFSDVRTPSGKIVRLRRDSIIKVSSKSEEIQMQEITGNYRVAIVNFLKGVNTSKEYSFALFDNNINAGDHVLCESNQEYAVAKIVEIVKKESYTGVAVTKEIICAVDFTEFEERKSRRAKAADLKAKMTDRIKTIQEISLYKMMAKEDPELAELLKEYEEVQE